MVCWWLLVIVIVVLCVLTLASGLTIIIEFVGRSPLFLLCFVFSDLPL